jgi:hypothetical protein
MLRSRVPFLVTLDRRLCCDIGATGAAAKAGYHCYKCQSPLLQGRVGDASSMGGGCYKCELTLQGRAGDATSVVGGCYKREPTMLQAGVEKLKVRPSVLQAELPVLQVVVGATFAASYHRHCYKRPTTLLQTAAMIAVSGTAGAACRPLAAALLQAVRDGS